jgi:hypothetical protein
VEAVRLRFHEEVSDHRARVSGPQTEGVTYTFAPPRPAAARAARLHRHSARQSRRQPAALAGISGYGYFNLRDYALADKKAGIEQLAALHSYIDIERVGIYGTLGRRLPHAAAMMLPPYNDFFKVGVSESGNHDNNIYNQNWSEQYHGLKVVAKKGDKGAVKAAAHDGSGAEPDEMVDSTFEIRVPTTVELAKNLEGNSAARDG